MITGTNEKLITICVADMKVSNDPDTVLVTYSLGSCLGILIYDPIVKVGGILHVMLPESNNERSGSDFNPFKYVDTGIPLLFKEAYKYGATKNRLKVAVAGGAHILDDSGYFNIGKRNIAMLRKIFWKNGVMIDKEHLEGNVSRTVRLKVSDGEIKLTFGGGKSIIL
jgi:chemotaxis protein CheD